jgi:hypothetical protein
MSRNVTTLVMSAILFVATTSTGSAEPATVQPPPSIDVLHQTLAKQLSAEQAAALDKVYPGFRLVSLCPGHFSGNDKDELVLGVWKPVESDNQNERDVHRVGLLWNNGAWDVHIIDDEIMNDEDLSHSFPMHWQYSLSDQGFNGDMKCGIESEFGEDSDLTYVLGDKPFFDLKKAGLETNKVVCFATDDVYNNWDCLVYSPKESRFKLWFQQAHAD